MYKNLKLFIILILFVNNVLIVYGQKFMPGPRVGQAAVLVGKDKIYYSGGYEFTPISSLFYLEFRKQWVDLSSQVANLYLLKSWHAADVGGANQDLIFMIGGRDVELNEVLQFDTVTNTLTTPIIQGKTPLGRQHVETVSYNGKIYLFSGLVGSDTFYMGFDILNTINMSWEIGSLEGAPIPRVAYTATLFNEIIYYIGGVQLTPAKGVAFSSMENVCKLII
jgi:hypothetical protein